MKRQRPAVGVIIRDGEKELLVVSGAKDYGFKPTQYPKTGDYWVAPVEGGPMTVRRIDRAKFAKGISE